MNGKVKDADEAAAECGGRIGISSLLPAQQPRLCSWWPPHHDDDDRDSTCTPSTLEPSRLRPPRSKISTL
ncbi:hypothetical protein Pyn_24735 [Prunus yedoensis var. nudiflora]|uniref:Uncharacterized protein n=1 Tax=Prunus yedoensis var. nudiflora TaxID=2094558 RepID=A0A314ZMZ1_PRUYE|nr:hypothetical protein Pyn_24735 [Prunus yedoensis var. nudiflora]